MTYSRGPPFPTRALTPLFLIESLCSVFYDNSSSRLIVYSTGIESLCADSIEYTSLVHPFGEDSDADASNTRTPLYLPIHSYPKPPSRRIYVSRFFQAQQLRTIPRYYHFGPAGLRLSKENCFHQDSLRSVRSPSPSQAVDALKPSPSNRSFVMRTFPFIPLKPRRSFDCPSLRKVQVHT